MIEKTLKAAAFAAVFIAAMSCKTAEPERNASSPERFSVKVSVPAVGTKVTSVMNEDKINDLQVFVFRPDGTLDAYASGSGTFMNLDCTAGDKKFIALANAPDMSGVASESALQAARSELDENSLEGFVMSGSVSETISEISEEVEISVTRLVARISVQKITNALSAPAYSDTDIKLTGIYLSNVAGDRQYLSSGTTTLWLNRLGAQTDVPSLLHSGGISYNIENGSSYPTAHYFYCYPNSTAQDSDDEIWSPRYTRLVIVTEIGGKTYYYPVSIGNIESNHLYDIENVQITRLGSDSPEFPVEVGSLALTIKVTDWQTGSSTNITI